MDLRFTARTNKNYCMINLAIFRLVNGTKIAIDRTVTDFEIEDGILNMTWENCYLWELCGYNIFDKEAYVNDEMAMILQSAKLIKLELEDDAEKDYNVWDIEWWCE